jgi:hypothetical protein
MAIARQRSSLGQNAFFGPIARPFRQQLASVFAPCCAGPEYCPCNPCFASRAPHRSRQRCRWPAQHAVAGAARGSVGGRAGGAHPPSLRAQRPNGHTMPRSTLARMQYSTVKLGMLSGSRQQQGSLTKNRDGFICPYWLIDSLSYIHNILCLSLCLRLLLDSVVQL